MSHVREWWWAAKVSWPQPCLFGDMQCGRSDPHPHVPMEVTDPHQQGNEVGPSPDPCRCWGREGGPPITHIQVQSKDAAKLWSLRHVGSSRPRHCRAQRRVPCKMEGEHWGHPLLPVQEATEWWEATSPSQGLGPKAWGPPACAMKYLFHVACLISFPSFPPSSCFISISLPFQTHLTPVFMGNTWQKTRRAFPPPPPCFKKYFPSLFC